MNIKPLLKRLSKNLNCPTPTPQLIEAINKLFVDIKIVKLNKDKLANELFKQNELLTFEQIRKSFFDVLNDLEKQKGDETRFKID